MGRLCELARRFDTLGVGAVFSRRSGEAFLVTSVRGKAEIPNASLLFRGLPLRMAGGGSEGPVSVGPEKRLAGVRKRDWALLSSPAAVASRSSLVHRLPPSTPRASPLLLMEFESPRGSLAGSSESAITAAIAAGLPPLNFSAELSAFAKRRAAAKSAAEAKVAAVAAATAAQLAKLAAARAAARVKAATTDGVGSGATKAA